MSIQKEVMKLLRDKLDGEGMDIGGRRRKHGVGKRRKAGVLVQGGNRKNKAAAKRSPWINYVKAYSEEHGISYKEALQEAGPSYRKMKSRAAAGEDIGGYIPVAGRRKRSSKKGGVPIGGAKMSKAELNKLANILKSIVI